MPRTRRLSILRASCRGVCVKRLTNNSGAFTIIELIVVIATILILVGIVLAAAGYVQKKGARSRAETEIAALSAALESYKADNGIYPRGNVDSTSTSTPYDTDNLDPRLNGDPTASPAPNVYQKASQVLYSSLSGDSDYDGEIGTTEASNRIYFNFKPEMLYTVTTVVGGSTTTSVRFIRDPFGNSYGYSTAQAANPGTNVGYNPTFDLWSTAGVTTNPADDTVRQQWIKNW